MNINKLIEQEKNFYEEINLRKRIFSEEQKDLWRKETVFERKQRLSQEL